MNIIINIVILATQEIIYRNRQIGGTLTLAEVRRMIKENLLVKFSFAKQNFNTKWDLIEDYRCNYRLQTD